MMLWKPVSDGKMVLEIWDAIGVEKIAIMKAEGLPLIGKWHVGFRKCFYTIKEGYLFLQYPKNTDKIPGQDSFIILNNIRESKSVE
jgi:3-hydroxyacyl-CoA dehydrogenase